ncbi:MAG TPA: TolC family protein [Thermoanaerobaculia bacterium]|nr:TolC family protein [Thermoanaerobaculia bacterium]
MNRKCCLTPGGRRGVNSVAAVLRLIGVLIAALTLAFASNVANAQQPTPTPLTLDEVVRRAIAYSPDVRALRASVDDSSASALLARQAFNPAMSVSTTPGYATGLPIAVLGQVPAIGMIEAHKVLFDSSASSDALVAGVDVDAAKAQLEARRRDVAVTAAELYAQVAAGEILVEAAGHEVAAHQTMLERTQALAREGRARDIDVERASLDIEIAQRKKDSALSAASLDELRLRRLIDWPSDQPLHVAPLSSITDTVSAAGDNLAAALASDPELNGLDLQIEQLHRAKELQRRLIQPTVAVQVQYARLFDFYASFYDKFRSDDASIGMSVTIPLWTGGRRATAAARLLAQINRLGAERESRRNALEIAVREAEADLRDAEKENRLSARVQSVARESLRLTQILAAEGRGTPNDVPQAEVALADADGHFAKSCVHLASARAKLMTFRGELTAPTAAGNAQR